jgi:hypothetical protein
MLLKNNNNSKANKRQRYVFKYTVYKFYSLEGDLNQHFTASRSRY